MDPAEIKHIWHRIYTNFSMVSTMCHYPLLLVIPSYTQSSGATPCILKPGRMDFRTYAWAASIRDTDALPTPIILPFWIACARFRMSDVDVMCPIILEYTMGREVIRCRKCVCSVGREKASTWRLNRCVGLGLFDNEIVVEHIGSTYLTMFWFCCDDNVPTYLVSIWHGIGWNKLMERSLVRFDYIWRLESSFLYCTREDTDAQTKTIDSKEI